jgi:outer membrane protein TolC
MVWSARVLLLGMFCAPFAAHAQTPVAAPRAPAMTPAQPPPGGVPMSLAETVFIGLRDNRAIRSEFLQRISDRFALRVAERAFVPRLDLIATGNRARVAGTTTNAFNLGPVVSWDAPTGARFTMGWINAQTNVRGQAPQSVSQLSFQVIQPLLAGGGIGFGMAPVRIARISESNAQLRLKGSVIDQITAIITAYRNLVQTQEQLRIAEASLRRARDLLEVNRALIAAGRIAQIELIQSEASIAQQELSLTAARNANEGARLALLLLMALDPASRIWASERPSADSVRVELPLALETAYNNQPAYLQSLLAIEISRIQLDVARNQRLWEVNLVAGAGPQASGLSRELVDTIGALGRVRSDFNIGLQVNIPIGQLRREQGEVNATVTLRQTELAAEQARDRVRQQVEDAVRNLEAQRRQAELARRSRELVAQQLQAELARLQAGRSSNFQVVSFQSQLQNAESAELGAVIGYVNALTTLDQVLGTTLDTWRITLNPP